MYRSGRMYVVPFDDELGEERSREFETLAEARNFRASLRFADDYRGITLRATQS